MTSPNADNPRNVTKYLGQNYQFTPLYTRLRDPASHDIKDPKNQGYYPYTALWINKTNSNLWALVKIANNLATWILLSSGSSGPLLNIPVPNGTTPVVPSAAGAISFTSTAGTITITGGTNTINFDLPGGSNPIEEITGDDGVEVVPDADGNINLQGLVVANGTHAKAVFTESPGANTEKIDVQVAAAIAATDVTKVGLSAYKNAQFSVDANGFVSLVGGAGPVLQTLSDDVGTKALPDGTGNIQLVGHVVEQGATKFSTTVQGTNLININPMSSARWIVDPLGFNGTHTTIAAAITSATAGDTIFLMPGTYTENPTLKVGVNLTAWDSDSSLNGTGNVIINGNCTLSTAGSVTITGIQLQTNSAALLTVSGSVASIVNLNHCYLNCSNNTGISYSSSSASSAINLYNCNGNLGTTGIALFSQSSAGTLTLINSRFVNTGLSSTANTISAGTLQFANSSSISNPITTSGTATLGFGESTIDTSAQNVISLTCGGSGSHLINQSSVTSGTASAISISNTTSVSLCYIFSSNTNAITGAGTINYQGLSFFGTSFLINTTTQTGGLLKGGQFQAPSAGFIGEQITASAAAVNVTPSGGIVNIASISLTAGIWDISIICLLVPTGTNTVNAAGISTANNTLPGTPGQQSSQSALGTGLGQTTEVVPQFRVTLTATTTYYLNASSSFSSGTVSANGRITATRVG